VRDHHPVGAQRFRGQYHALDRASFFELFLAQFLRACSSSVGAVVFIRCSKGERYTGEGNSAIGRSLTREAAIQD
jgi:hypothetical protein